MSFRLFYLLLLTFLSQLVYGQKDVFEIRPGQSISEVIPDSILYFSAHFVKGTAQLKSGRLGLMTLNYSRFFDEMMFINEKGDTLAVSNPDDFVYMKIGETTFYPQKNQYFEEVGQHGDLKLAQRVYFINSNQKKGGAMGGKNSNTSVDIINLIQADVGLVNLKANAYMDMKLKREYYFSDKTNQFKLLNKKNLMSWAKNKEKLKEYLTAHKVNFNDLIQIKAMFNDIALWGE